MKALRHAVLLKGGFVGGRRLLILVAVISALVGPSSLAQDQTTITNGLTQIAEELCRPDSALWYAPDGLGWRVYPIDYWQPMWVDFSEWPVLQNLKATAIATTNRCVLGQVFYGVQPLHVTITLDLLSGDMTLSPGCSSEVLATNSAPMGYQAGQWPVDCRVVERLWQQWQSIQSNPDWQESYGGDARPFLTFHFQLADLNEAQTYTQNLAAEEAAWENAQQSSSSVAVTMETGEGEEAEGTATCTVTNLTQPFNILSVTQDTNCWTTITWESCPVFRYIVWSSDELSTNTLWLQHAYVWGEPNATSWTDATTTNVDHRFYKVQRLLGNPISAGAVHNLVLRPDGTLWAWGYNEDGQLGDQTPGDLFPFYDGAAGSAYNFIRPYPIEVTAGTSCFSQTITNAVSAAAGGEDYSIVADAEGKVWTWGERGHGDLGDNGERPGYDVIVPSPINGVSNVVSVAAGGRHVLALRADGTVWAWGLTTYGQVGIGVTTWLCNEGYSTCSSTNVPVQCVGATRMVAIAAGTDHSVALDTEGNIWTWGRGDSGQLGDGGQTNVSIPLKLAGITNVIAIASGHNHTMALMADKTVWTWGDNSQGQLGRSGSNSLPDQVSGLSNVVAIAAGYQFCLAATTNGQVYAWGNNSDSQLGTLTSAVASTNRPMLVAGLSNAVSVSAHGPAENTDDAGNGDYTAHTGTHSLAMGLREGANQYWGWGANYYGQTGNGTNGYGAIQSVPELIQFCSRCERCVQLGTTGSFTAQCSGTLVLYFNDYQYDFDTESYGFDDNGTNSFMVTIGSITTNVPGNAAWGIVVGTVTNGGVYTYSASGFCSRDTFPHETDADGKDRSGQLADCSSINMANAICPTSKCFSLVGKIQ